MRWCAKCNMLHTGECPKDNSILDIFKPSNLSDKSRSCPACGGSGAVMVPPGPDWHRQTSSPFNPSSTPGVCLRCGGTGRA
jgi:hypothetical protein